LLAIAEQMQQTAARENTSVWIVSSLIRLGVVQAGVKLGQANIFDYYRAAFDDIGRNGLSAYVIQVSRPYMTMAANHLDPRQETYIERALKQVRIPDHKPVAPVRAPAR
jgi:hypothetical protein